MKPGWRACGAIKAIDILQRMRIRREILKGCDASCCFPAEWCPRPRCVPLSNCPKVDWFFVYPSLCLSIYFTIYLSLFLSTSVCLSLCLSLFGSFSTLPLYPLSLSAAGVLPSENTTRSMPRGGGVARHAEVRLSECYVSVLCLFFSCVVFINWFIIIFRVSSSSRVMLISSFSFVLFFYSYSFVCHFCLSFVGVTYE